MDYIRECITLTLISSVIRWEGIATSVVYFTDPTKFEHHLNKLHNIINIPFKVFHVIRNPFDNIATIALYA